MILAAGRGERMRPLTDTMPKPLLKIAGKALIQHHIENLARAGISEIVINHGVRGDMIEQYLGDGAGFGVTIQYSAEGDAPLETAGGIIQALPYFNDQPFLAVNADVYTDFDFSLLTLPPDSDAHLVLVENPDHHPHGDFSLSGTILSNAGTEKLTYSGIGIYHPGFFSGYPDGPRSLASLIRRAADLQRVTGQRFNGLWADIGTPARLQKINEALACGKTGAN